ncbi:MAG: signal peptidase II [bacterium]
MRVLIFSIVVVVMDQLTKMSVRYFFEKGIDHNIISDFVQLTYIENPGMAFGIQFGGQTFFTLFAAVASVIIFVYIVRARSERFSTRFALALILGGAIGNLIDRFLFGAVTDFINIGIGAKRWPFFNIADSAVTIGMVILLINIIFDKNKVEESKDEAMATNGQSFH